MSSAQEQIRLAILIASLSSHTSRNSEVPDLSGTQDPRVFFRVEGAATISIVMSKEAECEQVVESCQALQNQTCRSKDHGVHGKHLDAGFGPKIPVRIWRRPWFYQCTSFASVNLLSTAGVPMPLKFLAHSRYSTARAVRQCNCSLHVTVW